MYKFYRLALFIGLFLAAQSTLAQRHWIATTTGNWNDPNNWSTTATGPGGSTPPTSTDAVFFNGVGGRNGNCVVNVVPTINGLSITGYTGTIDLSGNTLTTNGPNTFTTGTVSNTGAAASLALNSTGLSRFNGTLFGAAVTGSSAQLQLSGSTFNNTVTLTKTGGTNDSGDGGNAFNGAVTLTNAGTAQLWLGVINPDAFNNTLTINSNSASAILLARNAAGTLFNNDITINYNNTGAVIFGNNGGTSTLANTRTITVASYGASGCGNLQLGNFTQAGTTTQNITLAGNETAILTLGPASTFNGPITTSSPVHRFNTSTFNNSGNFTQTSSTTTGNSVGGNLFVGTFTMTNTGDADFVLGNSGTGDTWNGAATFNGLGGGRIRIGESTTGNVFNGNATINSSGAVDNVNRIQISRLSGSVTTFFGTTTLNNNGNSSDIHVSLDPNTLTTFNGPLILNSGTSATGEFEIARDGNVVINGNVQVNSTCGDNIRMTAGSGTVVFGNGTITVGPSGFSQGRLTFQNFTQTGTAATNLTLTGTAILALGPMATFNSNVTGIAPRLILDGSTYAGTTYLEKTGITTDNSVGNNTFNGPTTLVNSNPGTAALRSGVSALDTFNGDLTLRNTGAGSIQLAYQVAGTLFNGNIVVNSTFGTGIWFGDNGGTSTLAANKTITVGSSGFSRGDLRLEQFRQTGATPQSLTLTSLANLVIGPASQFDGNVNFVAPQLTSRQTTYNGTAYLEKNGATGSTSVGGNIFNSTTTLVNSGSSTFEFGDTLPETFNGDLTVNNTGTYRIQIGISSANNFFGGNVTVNHGGNTSANVNTIIARNAGSTATFNGVVTLRCTNANATSGIVIGNDGTATFNNNIIVSSTAGRGILLSGNGGPVTLANGFTITDEGAGKFTAGTLTLQNFTQLGTTPQALTLTGSANLTIGLSSVFNGNVNFKAPALVLSGATYNGTTIFEKTGATNDDSQGNNIFNGVTTLNNSGSGYLRSPSSAANLDRFNNALNLNNSGAGTIRVADLGTGNTFAGNIVMTSTFGGGIFFGNGGGSSSLASGQTISVGGAGYAFGELRLFRFTQVGGTPQSIILPSSPSSTALLTSGPGTTFNGNVVLQAPGMAMNGTTFNGTAYLEKTGSTTENGTGNNIFNAPSEIVVSGTGNFTFANTAIDQFNADVILRSRGTGSALRMSHTAAGSLYNGNISVSSTSGSGVLFGNNGGSSTLATSKTIALDAAGFSIGTLQLRAFTQVGSTAQALTLTGTALLISGPSSTFNADVNFVAPQVQLQGATYAGTTYIEKNGTTANVSSGSNVFNGTTTIVNSANGDFTLANTTGDNFNGDITFTRTGSGLLQPAYNSTSFFRSNVTVNAAAGITFGANNGFAEFSGGNAQSISVVGGSAAPTFQRMTMNKTVGTSVTLNTGITISGNLAMTSGVINSSSTALPSFPVAATVSGANSNSYVNGPVRKTGNVAFSFPIGKNGFYRPMAISARVGTPNVITQIFTAEYFNTPQPFGGKTTWDPSFYTVSGCEYWNITRANGLSNVYVTLTWNENACGGPVYVSTPATLRVARWSGSAWQNYGNDGTASGGATGSVTASVLLGGSADGPLTLASVSPTNPLPIELERFFAQDGGATATLNWTTVTEKNNDFFTLERSQNGLDFTFMTKVKGAGNSSTRKTYSFIDEEPYDGLSYYRLIQTDYDGKSKSWITSLQRKGEDAEFTVYPNAGGNETIYFSQRANVTFFNSLNQVVMQADGVKDFDATPLPAGIYILRNQKGQVTRFVKK
ncbi:beta strand repeat-containing protein [Chryseolinea lacunae]|uniref:Secretion system C-terminal sorting domain-containing protein n=1 Tax=Chryseolinea lacunae TaxID=2801331 RepID=A0ABS1L015_9BACT|nr:hypothetical protein [Chryseolinea lacunae]MBL0745053.1 hypothetical protein [Chryseolinea lacunae]